MAYHFITFVLFFLVIIIKKYNKSFFGLKLW